MLYRIALLALILGVIPCTALAGIYTEDFTTTAFRDSANTTADWNTLDGELKLFPFSPALVGSVNTPGNARAVAIAGDYAYVTDASVGLQVIDITDPNAPVIAGAYGPANNVQDVALYGDYAYLADGTPGLLALDISNPATPVLVGFYNPATNPDKVAISGNRAVIGVGSAGIEMLDLSTPANPTFLGSFNTSGSVTDVATDGNLVYVADLTEGLKIIDVSNPASPALLGSYNTPGFALGVAVDGDWVYVADGASGLQVIDATDLTNPQLAGTVDTPGSASKVAAAGDRVHVADGFGGLQVIDVSDPFNPAILFDLAMPGQASSVVYAGAHAFVVTSDIGLTPDLGLRIIHVTSPLPPVSTAGLSLPGRCDGVDVAGNYLFSANSTGGLRIVDVTDPSSPVEVGSYVPPGAPKVWDVSVSGNLAALAADTAGVVLVDVSDPSSPAFLATHPTSGATRSVGVAGEIVYFGDTGAGFGSLDISNPATPVFLDSLAILAFGNDIEIYGPTAFYAGGSSVKVIDVTNPSGLVLLSQIFPGLFGPEQIAIAGDDLFVAASYLAHIDVTDPSSPVSAVSFAPPAGDAVGVVVTGDLAILATISPSLVYLLDISVPSNAMEIGQWGPAGSQPRRLAKAGQHLFLGTNATSDIQIAQFLQDESEPTNKVAQSLVVDGGNDEILRGRVVPIETPGASWELSADGGLSFQSVVPREWGTFSTPGTDLIWRSTLDYRGQAPVVSEVAIEWLNDFGEITAISDIPNDQGRQVRLEWRRSAHDFLGDPSQIVEYAVYRKIDPSLSTYSPSSLLSSGSGLSPAAIQHASAMQEAGWDFLATVPVRVQDDYAVVVPTLADSTIASGLYLSIFMVSALTATPGVFYDSYPDSGYSVDNLAPGVPQGFAAAFGAGTVDLSWDPAPEPDFQYFRVYRSTDPGFIPGPGNLVHESATTTWQDFPADPGAVFYKITALDHAGNESDPASSGAVTGVHDGVVTPTAFALRGAIPNPLRSGTRIAFDLPVDATVSLDVFDVTGRMVRNLAQEALPAGTHEVAWDGADTVGQSVAAGVYLYRLRAGTFEATRRIVVIR